MATKINSLSCEKSFDGSKKRKAECGGAYTTISYSKRMVPIVRDYPEGCGPMRGLITRYSQFLAETECPSFSSRSSSFYYSESDDDSMFALPENLLELISSWNVERKDVPQSLGTKDCIVATEFPEKVVPQFLPKGFVPPKTAIKVRRDFPIPPERLSIDRLESRRLKALDGKEPIDLEEISESEDDPSEEAKLEFSRSKNDLEPEVSFISMYNIGLDCLDLFGLSSVERMCMPDDMDSTSTSTASVNKPETSEHEATEFPPNSTDSGLVDFPKGYRKRGVQIKNILEATSFETKESNSELPDPENTLLGLLNDEEESCCSNTFLS